jgi:hypothetical protein
MKKGVFNICLAAVVTVLGLLSSTVSGGLTAKQQTKDVFKDTDGHKLTEWPFEDIPVFDSMAVAWEKLHWRTEKTCA